MISRLKLISTCQMQKGITARFFPVVRNRKSVKGNRKWGCDWRKHEVSKFEARESDENFTNVLFENHFCFDVFDLYHFLFVLFIFWSKNMTFCYKKYQQSWCCDLTVDFIKALIKRKFKKIVFYIFCLLAKEKFKPNAVKF